ncbi:hypothetical protein GLOIN_2v1840456 [Rhizophagus irregularis DAOM 181602=DAOM 197198]|nr:hypothetical protein GLOIN_2v1840456 [Rhizophagus irregularis DAOM 181602=DAOM 197198]
MCKNNNSDPPVTVKVINDSIKFSKILSWKKNLSQIRSELEENNSIIDMELSLFVKISTSKDEGERLEVIDRDDENKRTLEEIMDTKKKVLYLQKYPWENFNEDHKLEHGYTITNNNVLIKANKKAFTITNCEIKKIVGKRTEDNPKTKKEDFIEYSKVSLSFKLKPTEEFIIRVRKALESDNILQKLREIVKDYGEFISEEIILGGQVYFEDSSKNKYKLFVGGEKRDYSSFNEVEWSKHLNNLNNLHCIKLIKPISIFQLLPDELRKGVLSSIGVKIIYTKTEDCKYDLKESRKRVENIPQDVLTIFQNEDSECEIFVAVIDVKEKDFFNCRISHQDGEDPKLIIHCIQKKFKIRECKLKIRWMVIGYDVNFGLNSSDFDVQLEKFKVQNCDDHIYKRFLELKSDPSVLCFGIPKLSKLDRTNESFTVGHHFFDDQKNKKTGLCTFSYCLKQKQNVNLPEFTFHMFIIKCNNTSCNYGMVPFKKKISNWPKISINKKPKFISIYSSGENKCSPIFLKQKINGIKIKYLKCNNENNISQPRLHESDNLQHAYFQTNHEGRIGNNWVDKF